MIKSKGSSGRHRYIQLHVFLMCHLPLFYFAPNVKDLGGVLSTIGKRLHCSSASWIVYMLKPWYIESWRVFRLARCSVVLNGSTSSALLELYSHFLVYRPSFVQILKIHQIHKRHEGQEIWAIQWNC